MKRYGIIGCLLAAFVFTACQNQSSGKTEDGHNAQNALDYEGTYKGLLGEAKDTLTIQLKENSFVIMVKDSAGNIQRTLGKYSWNKEGNTVTLEGAGENNRFFVGENTLLLLDQEGKRPLPGEQEKRMLHKVEP